MNQYKKSYELKNTAKDLLDGKYFAASMICIFNLLVPDTVYAFLSLFLPATVLPSGLSVPGYAVNVLAAFLVAWVSGVINLGVILFFLDAACGQPYRAGNLFHGFRQNCSRSLTLSGVFALLNFLCLQPCQYLYDAYLHTRSAGLLIAAGITLIVGLCIYIPVHLSLALTYYLALDFPDRSAKEILALGFQVMRGQKRRLFYLECSFIPLMALCVCSLYIGFLWLLPYMQMTYTCFFLDVMNPRKAS